MEKQDFYQLGADLGLVLSEAIMAFKAIFDASGVGMAHFKDMPAQAGLDAFAALLTGAIDQLEEVGDPAQISEILSQTLALSNSLSGPYLDEHKEDFKDDEKFGTFMLKVMSNYYQPAKGTPN